MPNYFSKFGIWQNYAHYVLLTIGLFLWHSIPYTAVIESGSYGKMFIWYLVALFVIDSIVHFIFYYAPKPIQWRD